MGKQAIDELFGSTEPNPDFWNNKFLNFSLRTRNCLVPMFLWVLINKCSWTCPECWADALACKTDALNCFSQCLVLLPSRLNMSDVACKKRDDYLEWPEYFMAVAFLSAQRSKDPSSQVNIGGCSDTGRDVERAEYRKCRLKNAEEAWPFVSCLLHFPFIHLPSGTTALYSHQTFGQCFSLGWSLHRECRKQDSWDWVQWNAKWMQWWPVALEEDSRK